MFVGGCVQRLRPFWYSTLVGNRNFLIKTLKNSFYITKMAKKGRGQTNKSSFEILTKF